MCQCFIYEKDTSYILHWTDHFERPSNRIISEILFKKFDSFFSIFEYDSNVSYICCEILKHLVFHKESVIRIWKFCIVTKKKILWIMNSYLCDQWFLFRCRFKVILNRCFFVSTMSMFSCNNNVSQNFKSDALSFIILNKSIFMCIVSFITVPWKITVKRLKTTDLKNYLYSFNIWKKQK